MAYRIEAFHNRYVSPERARIDAVIEITQISGSDDATDLRLRLWTPQGARVARVTQLSPAPQDLESLGKHVSSQIREYPMEPLLPGEARALHVVVDVRRGAVHDELLACRPSIVYVAHAEGRVTETEDSSPEGRLFATFTSDESLSSRVDDRVARLLVAQPTRS